MPAPAALLIQQNITQALLAKGYTKKSYDSDGNLIEDKTKLPDKLADIVAGISDGVNVTWTTWQASQVVSGTAGPFPVVGTLP